MGPYPPAPPSCSKRFLYIVAWTASAPTVLMRQTQTCAKRQNSIMLSGFYSLLVAWIHHSSSCTRTNVICTALIVTAILRRKMLFLCALYLALFSLQGICADVNWLDLSLKSTTVSFENGENSLESGQGTEDPYKARLLGCDFEASRFREPYMRTKAFKNMTSLVTLMTLSVVSSG